jgi:hypothetical protein
VQPLIAGQASVQAQARQRALPVVRVIVVVPTHRLWDKKKKETNKNQNKKKQQKTKTKQKKTRKKKKERKTG